MKKYVQNLYVKNMTFEDLSFTYKFTSMRIINLGVSIEMASPVQLSQYNVRLILQFIENVKFHRSIDPKDATEEELFFQKHSYS